MIYYLSNNYSLFCQYNIKLNIILLSIINKSLQLILLALSRTFRYCQFKHSALYPIFRNATFTISSSLKIRQIINITLNSIIDSISRFITLALRSRLFILVIVLVASSYISITGKLVPQPFNVASRLFPLSNGFKLHAPLASVSLH